MDYTKFTNNELLIEKEKLENKFELTKTEINKLCDELINIEKNFNEVQTEINSRKNMYF